MLTLGGTVADFATTMAAECSLQRWVGRTLVEPDLGTALKFGSQKPVDDEQASSDAADFPQGGREFISVVDRRSFRGSGLARCLR